jgi:hypothetical protein
MVADRAGVGQGQKALRSDGPSTLPASPTREHREAMTSIIDLDHLDDVEVHLEAAAAELRAQWATALLTGDFSTIDRIAEASHAVHRALVALQTDGLVPSG